MYKLLVPFIALTFFLTSFQNGIDNSDTVAVYDLDSVRRGNERFQTEYKNAESTLEADRRTYKQLTELLAPKKANTDGIPVPKNQMPSGPDPGKMDKDRQMAKKKIIKDSLYLYDSLPTHFEKRIMKIAGDYQKQFGYKSVLTKEQLGTYQLTSNGVGSKTKNVTKLFTDFANQDSLVRKY
jgi:hypothetical protein